MAIRVIDDTKLQNIAVAIQSKDNGGQMTVDQMAGRIENIPSGLDFDMTVTNNQVKMVIEVNDYDLSYWTRFGIDDGGTVTVDWGDGTIESFTGDTSLEHAPQRKHNYQRKGRYLVTETVENGKIIIGAVGHYSTFSEGPLYNGINIEDELRTLYNSKIKELAFGSNVSVLGGLRSIPFLKLYSEINFYIYQSVVDYIKIKNDTHTLISYMFQDTKAFRLKIPSSINLIKSYAFMRAAIQIIDFTDISLDENEEFPITIESTSAFMGMSTSTILLFATQEIAEVAKTVTNLSQLASQIKYVGEV